jgi:DNA invertase Pin-like site-specific DNA recombinase
MKNGDTLIVFEASDLARSTLQVLEVMDIMARKGISLQLVRYKEKFVAGKFYDTGSFLKLMKHIEGEFVTKRTTDALARRRAAGLPLGRPKGRKNKSRKLDKHKAEIKKYLALNINKASIAKLVGCHAQTLYNYLEDSNLIAPEDAPEMRKKRRTKATS